MKKVFIFFLLLWVSFSCQKEDVVGEDVKGEIIRIKENKVSCSGYEGQTECYLVQQGDKIDGGDWEYFYEQIEGFDYEPGFVYKLVVSKEPVDNPPMDAPHVKYTLIRSLSKEPK